MNGLTFEYGGYHFTPYMKLTGRAGEFTTMAMNYDHKSPLFANNKFSCKDFYDASPIRYCDLFKCEENGKIYIPAYNLLEYKGELHGDHPDFVRQKNRDYER